MAIDSAVLNEKVEHGGTIHTGVYMSVNRNCAVVVKAKDGKIAYIVQDNSMVELRQAFAFTFAREYPLHMPNYPAKRALRAMRKPGFPVHPMAEKVFRAVLGV